MKFSKRKRNGEKEKEVINSVNIDILRDAEGMVWMRPDDESKTATHNQLKEKGYIISTDNENETRAVEFAIESRKEAMSTRYNMRELFRNFAGLVFELEHFA